MEKEGANMETRCPNCGNELTRYRTDKQMARSGEMIMFWDICPRCRHIALEHWEYAGGSSVGPPGSRRPGQ